MTSAFKNRVPRRKYQERAQPRSRTAKGLLEKRKDYQARARDSRRKQRQLEDLELKAQLKNQEEFYFRMEKARKREDGKIVLPDSDSDADDAELRKALNAANTTLVKHQRSMVVSVALAKQRLGRLRDSLHLLGHRSPKQHLLFEEAQAENPMAFPDSESVCRRFQTSAELAREGILDVGCPPRSRLLGAEPPLSSTDGDPELHSSLAAQAALGLQNPKRNYQDLADLLERERKLKKVQDTLELRRQLASGKRCRLKNLGGAKVHKFFLERSR